MLRAKNTGVGFHPVSQIHSRKAYFIIMIQTGTGSPTCLHVVQNGSQFFFKSLYSFFLSDYCESEGFILDKSSFVGYLNYLVYLLHNCEEASTLSSLTGYERTKFLILQNISHFSLDATDARKEELWWKWKYIRKNYSFPQFSMNS